MTVVIGPSTGVSLSEETDSTQYVWWAKEGNYILVNDDAAGDIRLDIWYSYRPDPITSATNIVTEDCEFDDVDVTAVVYGICAHIAERLGSSEMQATFGAKQAMEISKIRSRLVQKNTVKNLRILPVRM